MAVAEPFASPIGPGAAAAEVEQRVRAEQIREVYRQLPITLSATALNALLTAGVLLPVSRLWVVALWLFLVLKLVATRFVLWRRYRRAPRTPAQTERWARRSAVAATLAGVLWGGASLVMFPAEPAYQLFLAFVVGGMCAGAATVDATHLPSLAGFILPAALPLAARLLWLGSAVQLASGSMMVLFAGAMLLIGWNLNRTFRAQARLQLELAERTGELDRINAELRREIEDRRTVEATLQQAQKIEAIGQLTGGIVHDFNNLLTAILGNLELIRRAAHGDERLVQLAAAAERAADRGSALIGSLLAFARKRPAGAEAADANALLRDFIPLLRRAVSGGIHFETVLKPDLPLCRADPAQFQSAVLNLVINARDATDSGGTITVATECERLDQADLAGNPDADPGDFVVVTVRDTGSGMPPEVLARAFEPFFTTKGPGRGSGLGLAQVLGFARQSQGHVRLESRVGQGTAVTLYLPEAPAPTEPMPDRRAIPAEVPTDLAVSVLLVEDDPDVLSAIAEALGVLGCRVTTAADVTDALSRIRDDPAIDLLLTDIEIGQSGNGINLARQALRERPRLRVLLTSGHTEAMPAAPEGQPPEFPLLVKPFRSAELARQVRAALAG